MTALRRMLLFMAQEGGWVLSQQVAQEISRTPGDATSRLAQAAKRGLVVSRPRTDSARRHSEWAITVGGRDYLAGKPAPTSGTPVFGADGGTWLEKFWPG